MLGVAVITASCMSAGTPSLSPPASAAAPTTRSISAPVVTRLSIPQQTERVRLKVAPDHEHVLVWDTDAQSFTFFDLQGNVLATVDGRALGITWAAWLPDGSGAIFANGPQVPQPRELSVLRWGRPRVDLGLALAPDIDGPPQSPDGDWIALFVDCCRRHVVAFRLDASDRRELISSAAPISLLGWDARSHVLVQRGNDILRLGLDGTRISTDLGLPAGAHATSAYLSDQSPDRRVTVLRVAADRPLSDLFNGFGVRSLIDDSVSEVRPPRAYAIGWIGGHEKLMFPWETVSGRRTVTAYDAIMGSERPLGVIGDGVPPSAVSGRILLFLGEPSVNAGGAVFAVLRLGLDDGYKNVSAGIDLDVSPFPLAEGRFLVYGRDGWLYVIDGEAAAR